jgi:glycosyltransferase involved in cell wall biosynthesis
VLSPLRSAAVFRDQRVIVVDDAGSDDTVAIAARDPT